MPSSKSPTKPKPNEPRLFHEWAFEAIGTHFWIGIYEQRSAKSLTQLQATITERIETFDRTYSRFRKDSLVAAIARRAGEYEFPADAPPLFTFYDELFDATDGRVTPLIGQLLSDAGYDADYTLQPKKEIATVPNWRAVCTFEDGILKTTLPVLLDFGAAGKGYLVDIIAQLMREAGVQAFCIDGSGDLFCSGLPSPLRIGLENPHDQTQVIGVAGLREGALCASSGSRRAWGQYHHIMDPLSRLSPKNIAGVWATAGSCMLADGMTTALYFADPAQLSERFGIEYVVQYNDGSVISSADFPAELFIVKNSYA